MTNRTTKPLALGCFGLRHPNPQTHPSSFNLFNSFNFLAFSCFVFTATALAADPPDTNDATNAPDRLPPTTVVSQKQPAEAQRLPVSVTAVTPDTLRDADIQLVNQAAIYSPNTFINEFSARKLSNPFFRGIGAGPLNPAVTTFIDGVPQLNSYSSSIELIDVDQIEFVRGPQGALFGRNTAGGLINISQDGAVVVLIFCQQGSNFAQLLGSLLQHLNLFT